MLANERFQFQFRLVRKHSSVRMDVLTLPLGVLTGIEVQDATVLEPFAFPCHTRSRNIKIDWRMMPVPSLQTSERSTYSLQVVAVSAIGVAHPTSSFHQHQ